MNKVLFYFDVVSPWSYVAFQVIRRYQRAWNLDITYKPVNLGYVMKWSNNKPPISVINKGIWMGHDRDRAAIFYGVTLNPTKEFPINTMHAQTLLRQISDDCSGQDLEKSISAFYAAIWHDDKPVGTAQDLEAIMEQANLFDRAKRNALLEKSMTKEARSRLAQEGKVLAEEEGAFGMPWMVITRNKDGQTVNWFGSDRFEQIAAWLNQPYKGPFADNSVAKL